MSSDIKDLMEEEDKTWRHWLLITLASPLIAYYFVVAVFDYFVDMNGYLKDKLFLKRIRMTQAEFDQFMYWRIHVQNMPVQKLRPQPSFDDDDDCPPNWAEEAFAVDDDDIIERPRDILPTVGVVGEYNFTDDVGNPINVIIHEVDDEPTQP